MEMTINSNVINHGENKENYDPSSNTFSQNGTGGVLRPTQKIRQTRSQVHGRPPLLEIPVNNLRGRNNELSENVSDRNATAIPQVMNNRSLTQVGSHVFRVRNDSIRSQQIIGQRSVGRTSIGRRNIHASINDDIRRDFRQTAAINSININTSQPVINYDQSAIFHQNLQINRNVNGNEQSGALYTYGSNSQNYVNRGRLTTESALLFENDIMMDSNSLYSQGMEIDDSQDMDIGSSLP
ncbi:9317_t:CDS:2 [Cetraspora pellucida]|uniref:9317_t:CDS:1 n=1 Tax=Cetraspora pellucida TaxID=1433469 RepID=A0ACA9JWJ9_9GLOM|nr:9317_t:CDS:2 [Cetraspora pellucida]